MKTSNHLLIKIIFLFIFLYISPEIMADPPDPGGDPPEPGGGAPIGDGIIVLIIASFGYLLFYIRKLLHCDMESEIQTDMS